jgi:signal transduction histidine kinase/ligand-binding sensor domain-containing protein
MRSQTQNPRTLTGPMTDRIIACFRLFLVLSGLISTALAQYRFDHWTADTGLPQNIIRAIHQTPDGYLWLATLDGLVRFDGVRFTVFNKMNSPGINSNRFIALYEDREGALWLGTESSGVTRYHQGRFTSYTMQHGLASNVVPGISGDREGNVLVLSGNQVMRWDQGKFFSVATIPPSNDLGMGQTVIAREKKGGFWSVDDRGLSRFAHGRLSVWTRRDGLPSLNIHSVAEDRHGALWVATRDAGLVRIEAGRVAPVRNRVPGQEVWFIGGSEIKAFSKDRQGAFWLTDLDSGRSHLLTRQLPPTLAPLDFLRLHEDREGNIWIGAEGGGLHRARKQTITTYSKEDGLAGRNTYPIYEDRAGAIWIGADGLNRFAGGTFSYFASGNGLLYSNLSAIGEDRDGRLWIGTVGGVQVFSGGRLRIAHELGHVLAAPRLVQAICQARDGALWFGADNGLVRYQNGATTKFTTQDGLAGDDIKVIIEGADGRLWIGSYSGLTLFKDGKFKVFTERDGLPSNSVRALYEDRDGTLWIGTYDGGLGRFKDDRFTRYTTRGGLYNDGVFQILEDSRGNFWMSSNRGIYRVRKQELNDFAEGKLRSITSVAYGKSDGMLNAECNGGRWPAGIRARDGKLWFPTQDGVAVVDPETIQANPHPPSVLIESFLLDREPVAIDPQRREVRIPPDKENFEIGYTALSLINSELLRFKYKLEGLDHDWTEAGTRRSVYYSHIPPGDYVFKVIAANSDGVWNMEGQSLRITVLPPFYRTWWFLTLVALSVMGTVFAAFKYRIHQLEQRQAAQQAFARQLIESQERERQRIAAELHDSLGQNLLIIKNRALLGQLAAEAEPQFREQFEQLAASAAQSVEEVREIARNLRPYHLDRLGLTEALEDMIEKVAASTTIRLIPELVPLDDLFSKEAAITLYRVVQESLNNIVKHSQASEARVSVERKSDAVTITIADNGRGFAPPRAEAKGGGFGLAGMAERARILGGELSLHSREGQGTIVRVRIELKGR